MANTIARAIGYDASREKRVQRLGSRRSWAQVATYNTFSETCVNADGSGWTQVRQNGTTIHTFEWGPETDARPE